MTFAWMAWTPLSAGFFLTIVLLLAAMTVWEVLQPTRERRGLLPISTTRGDRFFIGLLGSAFIHLFWLGLTPWPAWGALLVAICWMAAMLRYG
jgi:predicted small integral membrane protein